MFSCGFGQWQSNFCGAIADWLTWTTCGASVTSSTSTCIAINAVVTSRRMLTWTWTTFVYIWDMDKNKSLSILQHEWASKKANKRMWI